jgi:hypothetical protein
MRRPGAGRHALCESAASAEAQGGNGGKDHGLHRNSLKSSRARCPALFDAKMDLCAPNQNAAQQQKNYALSGQHVTESCVAARPLSHVLRPTPITLGNIRPYCRAT